MRNDDFDNGYNDGKKAAHKGAGWIAGLASAIWGPVADKVSETAGELAANRDRQATLRREAEAAQWLAFDQKTQSLHASLELERSRRRPWRLRYLLVAIFLGLVGGSIGYEFSGTSPSRWNGALFLGGMGMLLGIVIMMMSPGAEKRRIQEALRKHGRSMPIAKRTSR